MEKAGDYMVYLIKLKRKRKEIAVPVWGKDIFGTYCIVRWENIDEIRKRVAQE